MECTNDIKQYMVTPISKNCTWETTEYIYTLSTGKKVTLEYTTVFRGGELIFNLTDEEYENIDTDKTITSNMYDMDSIDELNYSCSDDYEILNEDKYSKEEKAEYMNAMLNEDGEFDECELEELGWTCEMTTYGIEGGFEIEPLDDVHTNDNSTVVSQDE